MGYKVGDKLIFIADEFDGYLEVRCTVTEVHEDYAIAIEDGVNPMSLWIDNDTAEMFKRA